MTNSTVPNSLKDVFEMPIEKIKEQFGILKVDENGDIKLDEDGNADLNWGVAHVNVNNIKDKILAIKANSNEDYVLDKDEVAKLKEIRKKLHPFEVWFIYAVLELDNSAKIHFEKITKDEGEIFHLSREIANILDKINNLVIDF